MTQVNPDERYQGISEVITDLEFLKSHGSQPTTQLGRRDFTRLVLIAVLISGFSVYGWRVLVMGIRPFELKTASRLIPQVLERLLPHLQILVLVQLRLSRLDRWM
jgi:hypothetical protein